MKLMIKAGIVEPAEMLKYSDYLEAILLTMKAQSMTNEESLKTLDLLLSHMRTDMQRTIKAQTAPVAKKCNPSCPAYSNFQPPYHEHTCGADKLTIDSRCPSKSTH